MGEFIESIEALINGLGFPIAMVVYFIWDKTKITNQLTQAIQVMSQSINNNTNVLTRLLDHLNKEELINE